MKLTTNTTQVIGLIQTFIESGIKPEHSDRIRKYVNEYIGARK